MARGRTQFQTALRSCVARAGVTDMDSDALAVCEQVSVVGRTRWQVVSASVWRFGLVVLLVVELIALGICFDTGSLARLPQWWARAVGASPIVPGVLIAVLTAIVIFGDIRLNDLIGQVGSLVRDSHRYWPRYLVCHFFSLAGFTALTWFILEGEMLTAACPGLWFFAWAASGVGTLAFWGAAAVPPSLWPSLLRRTYRGVLVGVAVGFVAWRCGGIASELWQPMNRWAFELVRGLLGLVVPQCICEPAQCVVGTPSFSVCIDKACSGYQGIGLICVFFAFYLWFYRKTLRFPQAFLLVPLGVAGIGLANVLRIVALILIGTWFSPAVALGGFHSQAGWLALNAVALGLVAVAGHSPFFNAAIGPSRIEKMSNPSVPYLAPFLVALGVAMVTGAFSNGFDWLYPIRVLAVLGAVWYFRGAYADFVWSWSWQAIGLGALTAVLWIALVPAPLETSSGGFPPLELAGMPSVLAAGWWVFRVAGYVIAAPLAEELAFRGYVTRRLISADFDVVPLGQFSWLSFVASSVLFGAFHGRLWFVGCLAGMLFAVALYRRGRITDALLAHATANGLLATYAATTGNWYLWS